MPPLAPQCTGPPTTPPSFLCGLGRVSERFSQREDGERLCPADADGRRAEGAVRGCQDHPERLQEIQGVCFHQSSREPCHTAPWRSKSTSVCLQGRRLKEQQDMAAAVIQRCYRKYKQVRVLTVLSCSCTNTELTCCVSSLSLSLSLSISPSLSLSG